MFFFFRTMFFGKTYSHDAWKRTLRKRLYERFPVPYNRVLLEFPRTPFFSSLDETNPVVVVATVTIATSDSKIRAHDDGVSIRFDSDEGRVYINIYICITTQRYIICKKKGLRDPRNGAHGIFFFL